MEEILVAREKRANHILALREQFKDKTIVILKLNVPGNDKNLLKLKFIYRLYHEKMMNEFQEKIIKTAKVKSLDGDYFFYVINEDGKKVKAKTVLLEETNAIGKLVDLDVYQDEKISRTELGYCLRKCLICNQDAHLCVRSKAHSLNEVFAKIDEMINDYLEEDILAKTLVAIQKELDLFPKFGLVSKENQGCHLDMDYQLFLKSTKAITPYLKEFIAQGLNHLDEPLLLKEIGKEAEAAMFQVTNNINTQKGLIFLMGIFLPAISKAIIYDMKEPFIRQEIKRISTLIIGDYFSQIENKANKSHGDIIYLKHNLKGIRGEGLNGLKLIFTILPSLKPLSKAAMMDYFLQIMSVLDDTTIIYKTDFYTLKEVKETMKELVKSGGYLNNIERINQLSAQYIKRNISPGGASDMLVIKILYEELVKKYNLR